MANPYPNLVVDSKWIGWNNASNPAQHAIFAPIVDSNGDIFLSPGITQGTNVNQTLMKISGLTRTKDSEIFSSGYFPYNMATYLPNGKLFHNQVTVAAKAIRYNSSGSAETSTSISFMTASPTINLGIKSSSTVVFISGNSGGLVRPFLVNYSDTPMTYVAGSTYNTWSSHSSAYDSSGDYFFCATASSIITKFNSSLGVVNSYNSGSVNSWKDFYFLNGYLYACTPSPLGRFIKIDPASMTLSGSLTGSYRSITSDGIYLFALISSGADDYIDIVDPSSFSVLHTFAAGTSSGAGPDTARYLVYDSVYKRLIAVNGVNETYNEYNISFIDLSPLPVPQNLTATGAVASVALNWDAAEDADFYIIYWDTSPGVTQQTGNQISEYIYDTSYVHYVGSAKQTYYYVVTACYGTEISYDESDDSNEASAEPIIINSLGSIFW